MGKLKPASCCLREKENPGACAKRKIPARAREKRKSRRVRRDP